MTTDISDFYLSTPLKQWKYVKLSLRNNPEEVIAEFKLPDKSVNGHVYVKVRKGMYGLLQSGILANKHLEERLEPFGYK